MNERILELLTSKLKEWGGGVDDNFSEELEKFAELIIRECANFLDENSGYDDAGNSWHPEPEDLLNYFGVEE